MVGEPYFTPGVPIVVDRKGAGDARPGDLAMVSGRRGRARVQRVLGTAKQIENVLEALLVETGARQRFEPHEAPAPSLEGRVDLRDELSFTIDPETAKDFDDALTLKADRVYVHIADVSYYVPAGAPLDRGAAERAFSTYVPGRVAPMLPPDLSEDLCSLRPHEDRLCVTVEIPLKGGEPNFYRSVIRSRERFTYGRAEAILAGRERAESEQAVQLLLAKLADLKVPTPPAPDDLSPADAAALAARASELVTDYAAKSGRGREAFPALVLRALKQARYNPQNLGHSGLASSAYCHFTSPIRRYPDLVVHRALLRELDMSGDPVPPDLGDLADHASERERAAADVEYRADDICLAWLLDAELYEQGWEEPFEGEIIGVIGSGLFARFGEVFEGFLPARRLPGDYFELNDLATALVGRRGGGTFRLGDPIEVRVQSIDKPAGKVELAPAR